jgi:general stress protein 26
MIDEQVRAVLAQSEIVRLTTVQSDGYPHTVPVWFMLDGDDLIVFSGSEAQKVKNVQQNNKGNISFGGDPAGSPCYTILGDIEIEDDLDHALTARITYHYEKPKKAEEFLTEWKDDPHVILRLKPKRIINAWA